MSPSRRRPLWRREPVRIAAAWSAAINLAVSFGLALSAEQVTNLNIALLAAMALWVRGQVSPVIPSESPGVPGDVTPEP